MTYFDIWRKHAEIREGVKYEVYLCSEGFKTAGIGHLLTREEKAVYNVGDKVSKGQVDEWFKHDTFKAEQKALKQAKQIGFNQDWFIAALISVNFQLGDWTTIFTTSYPALVRGEYDNVIANLRRSKWYRQTPVRVEDFIAAIERMKRIREKPLTKSRTMTGAAVAGAGVAAELSEVAEQIKPLVDYSEYVKLVFVAITLVGIGLVVYARYDDRRNGRV
jgi:GH24 family phage-related lysozyme (muramidase)